jgi:hypothetical protein
MAIHPVLGDHDVVAIELKTSECTIKEKTKLKKETLQISVSLINIHKSQPLRS